MHRDMQADYKGKKVNVTYVANDKSYALISYNEDKSKQFKVDISELTNHDQALQAELKREP